MTPAEALRPEHVLIAPLLIPLIAGALMLFYDERRRWLKFGIGLLSVLALIGVAGHLLQQAEAEPLLRVYMLGNWPVPMGIVLVHDRLSALMVMATALLALAALIYAAAGWQGKGQHFHTLFQFLLFGMNGAFMTGDLFNLFVFFEVMLAASYGLLLHGSGPERIKAGLHYIAINLTASLLFLIGIALIYGVTGSLNMAQLHYAAGELPAGEWPLFHAGAALLGMAFLIKAGIWPLGFWLPRTYSAASPPVGAMLALMSKVGVYAILRLSMLLFGPAGADPGFGGPALLIGGIATMVYGTLGVLSAEGARTRAAHVAVISSGTAIAMTGVALLTGGERMLGGMLFYLLGSALVVGALLMVGEIVERPAEAAPASVPPDPRASNAADWGPMGLGAVDDDEAPASEMRGSMLTVAVLFAALTAVAAGLPPFSGFIGKFAMISGLIAETARSGQVPVIVWVLTMALIVSGFATLLSFLHFGIDRFWVRADDSPRLLALEIAPVAILLSALLAMTLWGEAAIRTATGAAKSLIEGHYVQTVMSVQPADPAALPEVDTGDQAP